jgi:hypothetical protein
MFRTHNELTVIFTMEGLGLCANNFAGNMSQVNMNNGVDYMAAAFNSAQQQHFQGQQQIQYPNQNGTQILCDNDRSLFAFTPKTRDEVIYPQPINKVAVGCEKTAVLELLPILLSTDSMGDQFRASYTLSFGAMFPLPPILSSEDYYRQFTQGSPMPKYDAAALQAAHFSELAIGAMVDGKQSIMHKLINASILCLQDSVKEPAHPSCQFELARAFFFHSILRCYNGDMERSFKYRRACINSLAKLGVSSFITLKKVFQNRPTIFSYSFVVRIEYPRAIPMWTT